MYYNPVSLSQSVVLHNYDFIYVVIGISKPSYILKVLLLLLLVAHDDDKDEVG